MEVVIVYRNHANRVEQRTIEPQNIWFGKSEFHPRQKAQWFMRALCQERNARRDFAIKDILDWRPA